VLLSLSNARKSSIHYTVQKALEGVIIGSVISKENRIE
jgi:hypothetical protein